MSESPELIPGPEDCVVHVRCNGVCGSDIHFWKHGQIDTLEVTCPYVLGHEGAGVIVWIGSKAQGLGIGDRVAIEPGVPCGQCFQCSAGSYHLCHSVEFSGALPHHGSMRRFHVHPGRYLQKLPDNLSFADGALLEPLSVVMHGFERSPVQLGEVIVICGAGPIGLTALAVARASGACPIVIIDIDQGRLDSAATFVPGSIPIRVQPDKTLEQMASIIIEKLGGSRPWVVYECTGVESSVITACYVPRLGGQVMVIGVWRPKMDGIPFMQISLWKIDLKFINRYYHCWPLVISAVEHGILDLKPLVTHTFGLEEADKALRTAADRTSGSVKVHVVD